MSSLKLNGTTVISNENITKTPMFTDSVKFPAGHVIKTSNYKNTQYIILHDNSNDRGGIAIQEQELWSFFVDKKLGASDSNLFVISQLVGHGAWHDYCSAYCTMDNAIASEGGLGTNEGAYKGTAYYGPNATNETYFWATLKKFSQIPAGRHRVIFGWKKITSGNCAPFLEWNPSFASDSRNQHASSMCQILEVKI